MKTLLICGAAAAALIAGTAALAQAAPSPMADKVMTRAEVQAKVRDHFAKIDANRDGVVTSDEMAGMHGPMNHRMMATHDGAEAPVMAEQPNVVFDRIDANHDGMISRDEFAKNRQVRIEKRIVMRDGKAEGGKHMKRMHAGMGGMMMRMADTNKDGKITLAEAEAAAVQHFDMADSNHDGKITRDERKQMHQRMRAEHQQTRG